MLDKILEFQEIESELVSQETELAKSKDREKAAQIGQSLKNGHARLVELEKQAKEVNRSYNEANKKYQEYLIKLETLEREMENAEPEKSAIYEKAFKDFSAVANVLEKEISRIYGDVQQINKEYENIIRKSKTDRENFDRYKASYAKLKAEKEPIIEGLKEKLKEKEKGIDEKLLNIYRQKRENKLFPVFVQLANNKCGGCRMEISASKLGQMNTNKYGIIECENCGRFIYKK
jgi:predicted  nucleic acid-binding Zn-ribbon protein